MQSMFSIHNGIKAQKVMGIWEIHKYVEINTFLILESYSYKYLYLKKEEKEKFNNLSFYHKKLEKEKTRCQARGRK